MPLDVLFQEGVEPSRSLATDRHLLNGFQRAAKSPSAVLRAFTTKREGISAGRYHRLGERALEEGAWRRFSGGRACIFAPGVIGFSFLLPHRSALVAENPFALAPYQIPNRYVRGLLRSLRAIGVDAFYPGRDFITVSRKTIGMITFDVDDRGALVLDVVLAVDRPFELRHAAELSGDSDGGIQQEIFSREITTSLAAETGRSWTAREVVEAIAAGYAEQFRLEIHRRELTPLEEQAIDAIESRDFDGEWTRGAGTRAGLGHRAVTPIALGMFEARVAIEQGRFLRDVQLAGDFIARASAVEALERELRLCPADWSSIAMIADRVFAGPESFILGIGKIRTIPDTILRAIPDEPRERRVIDSELDVEALHEALTSGEPARQLSAIDALLECDRRGPLAEELLGPLLDALGHERKALQRTAAEALALWSRATPEIGDRLRVLVRSAPLRHRFGAAFALAKIGPDPETLPVLLETLGEADGDMRWAAATLVLDLVRRRPEMHERLVALAQTGTPGQRKMCLYCLRDLDVPSPPLPLGERSAVKPPGEGEPLEEIFLSNLTHEDPAVRLAALAALGKHFTRSEQALRAVLHAAASDDDVGVRRAAVSRVTDYPAAASDAEAGAVLRAAESSDDPALRRAAEAARRRAARATGDST